MHEQVNNTRCFVSVDDRAGERAVIDALRWLDEYAAEHASNRGVLAFAAQDSVRHIARAIGSDPARELRLGRAISSSNASITAVWGRQTPPPRTPAVVMWPTDKRMDDIERLQLPAVCAVPTTRDRIQRWLRAWTPVDLAAPDRLPVAPPTINSPVVLVAMRELTRTINHVNGVATGDGKAMAILFFRALAAAGEGWDADEIVAWAARNGWRAKATRDLHALISMIEQGRRPRIPYGSPSSLPSDVVTRWRERAT